MARRQRLDVALVDRGHFATRAQAQAAVLAGDVSVNGTPVEKPGSAVDAQAEITIRARRRYVSRGGDKLDHALTELGIEVVGEAACDLGASTGGFVDRLLQGGATAVIAVDVGYGQLDWRLREDPRVTVLERTNARNLTPADLPFAPTFVTADVSFVSLSVVLDPVLKCMRRGYRGLVLVKPQFEAGRERVGKGGVVRDAAVHRDVLAQVCRWLSEHEATVTGVCDSGHPGPKGNIEYFVAFTDARQPVAPALVEVDERIAAVVVGAHA